MSSRCKYILLTLLLIFFQNNIHADHDSKRSKYLVGSTTMFIHDFTKPFDAYGLGVFDTNPASETRGACLALDNRGTYTLVTEVWYPVDYRSIHSNSRKAYFYDFYFATGANDTAAFNEFLLGYSIDGYNPSSASHIPSSFTYQRIYQGDVLSDSDPRYQAATQLAFSTARASYKDAPISKKGKFPVVVMFHGNQDCRITHYRVAEYLASQGYVVIACDITGIANLSLIGKDPDLVSVGNGFLLDPSQPGYPFLDSFGGYHWTNNSVSGATTAGSLMSAIQNNERYIEAIGSILSALPNLNSSGFFKKKLNLKRLGVAGHSFGGAATIERFTIGNESINFKLPEVKAIFGQHAGSLRESEALRSLPTSINLLNYPYFTSGMISYLRAPVIDKAAVYYWTGEQDDTIVRGQYQAYNLGQLTTSPTTENPQPATLQQYENTVNAAFYATYKGDLHNNLNSFHPYQLFSPLNNPGMPTNLLTKAPYSLYTSSGTLISFPFVAPFQVFTLVNQRQYQTTFNFANKYFFDAYLRNEKRALRKLIRGNGDPNLTYFYKNVDL
jgi:dienelactone hydrolase